MSGDAGQDPAGGAGQEPAGVAAAVPVLTVLVPAWNAASTIGRALASVLEVRDLELECIVVDDGSTDGTADVVRGIAAADARVVLLALDRNEGVSNARNRGLEMARGSWLTLLDADDRFLPGGLATLARAAIGRGPRAGTGSPPLAVIGQQVWTDGRRRWLTPFYDIPDIRRPGRTSLAARPGLLRFVSPHAKLLHRSAWEGLAFEGRVLGDQPWVIRALLRAGDAIEVLGDTVYEWHRPKSGHVPGMSGAAEAGRPASITTTTRSEVDRGLEAMVVATGALASVRDEARARLDPPAAEGLERAYVARLLAMDVAAHVGAALNRSDREVGRLFDGIVAFLAGVPREHLAGSDALARSIVELPLRRWWRVPREGHAAYWRLVAAARAVDPALADRGSSPAARLALALATRGAAAGSRTGARAANLASATMRAGAAAILMGCRLASGARRVATQAVRQVLSWASAGRNANGQPRAQAPR